MNYKKDDIIFKELSYKLYGTFFETQNKLGRFCRESTYASFLAKLFSERGIKHEREKLVKINGFGQNRVDFCVEGCILVDLKAKTFLQKEDYYQMLRYLEAANIKLGVLVNFRRRFLQPKRIINSKYMPKDS